mgnify:CR=1 FL=1
MKLVKFLEADKALTFKTSWYLLYKDSETNDLPRYFLINGLYLAKELIIITNGGPRATTKITGKKVIIVAAGPSLDKNIELLKKAVKDGMPEDVEKDAEAEVQKVHDKFIKMVDDCVIAKDKEIMTV